MSVKCLLRYGGTELLQVSLHPLQRRDSGIEPRELLFDGSNNPQLLTIWGERHWNRTEIGARDPHLASGSARVSAIG